MRDLQYLLQPYDLISRYLNEPQSMDPRTIDNLRSFRFLYERVKNVSQEDGRRIIVASLANSISPRKIGTFDIYREFRRSIAAVKDFLEYIRREFLPDRKRFPFSSDGVVRATNDPLAILNMAWDPPGDPYYHVVRSFEANLFWHVGLRYFLMRQHNDTEDDKPELLPQITLRLERDFFAYDTDEDKQFSIDIYYDPDKHNQFLALTPVEGKPFIRYEVWCRFIRLNGQLTRVLYAGREKREEDTFRKTLINNKGDHPVVSDSCGISIVFFTEEDLQGACHLLQDTVFTNSAAVTNMKINGENGKHCHKHSLREHAPNMQFGVQFGGGNIEVQMTTIDKFFNRAFTTAGENHHLYRLRQILPLLQLFFPREIYLDLQTPENVRLMEQLQINRILTNFM